MLIIAAILIIAFFLPFLLYFGLALLVLFGIIVFADFLLLFSTQNGISAKRMTPEKLSNGDINTIQIDIKNHYKFPIEIDVVDEIPYIFEERLFAIKSKIEADKGWYYNYTLKPVQRGTYDFGAMHIFVKSPIKMLIRRYSMDESVSMPVYPSFMRMRDHSFTTDRHQNSQHGEHKIRRIGHSMEFEKIKEYVMGDDVRSLNWKATAKSNKLMVNQYQEERSQTFYCIIDTGRIMKMPFDDLTLLDYSINATIALSNVVLKRHDLMGLITFSRKVDHLTKASKRVKQLAYINESLYKLKTDFKESDFQRLYIEIKKNIPNRSTLFIFSNFETMDGMQRQLQVLQKLAKNHKVVVIMFQNSELNHYLDQSADTLTKIIYKTVAEKLLFEKKLIIQELQLHGIPTIFTEPQKLSSSVIQFYLQMKKMTY
ncbi:MAG: DUF58 domain-containing protein [Saprospiraceae bacterium]